MLQLLTSAYNHEREILEHCGNKRLSHVVLAIDSGETIVPGLGSIEGRVYYLIFEMAACDVRVQMDISKACDALWCMRALRDVSLALWQIHRELIAHQDTKPSNVLAYAGPVFKLADFGRSSRRGVPSPFDGFPIAGDRGYAPPELIYGFTHPDFTARRVGCDLHMLGNLAAFLFTGVNITALLLSKLDDQHRPQRWSGSYHEVLPYLQNAFSNVLEDIAPMIDIRARNDVVSIIRELSNPDLAKRGDLARVGRPDQYSLERYVSRTDLIAKRLSVRLAAVL